MNIATGSNWQ